MKSTINVTIEHLDGIIKELDNSKYFLLNLSNETASRTDLFNFALALGLKEGEPTPLETSKGLIRTSNEDVKPYFFMYKSIYFDKVLSKDESKIDDITDIDSAFDLVEQYANTGFDVLERMRKEFPEDENFMKKLLTQIDEMHKEYVVEYGIKTLYTE
jgi:hypothetical protein